MLEGMYTVGEVVRQARESRGWSQRRLAEVSGVSQPNLAAIETGTRMPSLAMVTRLVRVCGLQLRYELEPRHADVDARMAEQLARPPLARLGGIGLDALIAASRLAMNGVRLVADGPFAARLLGAPVADSQQVLWCDYAELDRLRLAVARCHLDLRPVRARYVDDEDGFRMVLADGDEVRVGQCTIRLGSPPPAPWVLDPDGQPQPVVGIETLLAYADWTPADRVAVRRLAVALDERGQTAHGLDKAP